MPRVSWKCACGFSTETSFEGRGQGLGYVLSEVPLYARPGLCPHCESELVTSWICGDCGGSTDAVWRPDRCPFCGLSGTMNLLRTDNPAAGCTQVAVSCAGEALAFLLCCGILVGCLVAVGLRLAR
jgi:hypothetical protein